MLATVILLSVVVALLVVLVVGLLRSHGEILRRLHELGAGVYDDAAPAGATTPVELTGRSQDSGALPLRSDVAPPRATAATARAHDITGLSPRGSALAVGVHGAETTLLAFLSSGCGTCGGFWDAFRSDGDVFAGLDVRLVIVTKSPAQESPAAVAALAPQHVTTVMSSEAYEDYAVAVSPYFVLVDGPAGAVVGEGAATTWPHVRDLMRQALADSEAATGAGRPDGKTGSRSSRTRRAAQDGRAREARVDAELMAAGIGPGDASLYPDSIHVTPVRDGEST